MLLDRGTVDRRNTVGAVGPLKRGLGEGSGLGEPVAVAERQRELHQHREHREPGAVPDIRPEPLHLETPPHIARHHPLSPRRYNVTSPDRSADVNGGQAYGRRQSSDVSFEQLDPDEIRFGCYCNDGGVLPPACGQGYRT